MQVLAATPVGMRVILRVEADDDQERVGEGTHERFVVDMKRFMGRIASKRS